MILKTGTYNVKVNNYTKTVSLAEKNITNKITVIDNNVKQIITEMQKMKDNSILRNTITDYSEEEIEYSIYGREYGNQKNEYVINRVKLTTDGEEAVDIQIEEKTGKVLEYISAPKYAIVDDISEEEILRNYIKYLELYIIDDWIFQNGMLISEKAKLVAILESYTQESVLTIHSTNNEYIRKKFDLIN